MLRGGGVWVGWGAKERLMMLADKIRQLTAAARRRRRRRRRRRMRMRRGRRRMRRRKRREECLHHFLTPMYVSSGSNQCE